MRRLGILAALALVGCPSDPPGVDLTLYQACSGACVVAFDVARACDAAPPLERAVAVAAERRAAYEEALGSQVCRARPYDDFFLESLLAPRCEAGTCQLGSRDPMTGIPCERTEDCAQGYRCLDVIGLPGPVCVAVEGACMPPELAPPEVPAPAVPTDLAWRPTVPASCAAGEARIGEGGACVRVGSVCATDGWPADLPTLGVVYVDARVAGPGQGTRADPFPSIASALATTATIAALAPGTYDVPDVGRDFALVGACASATSIRGAVVTAGRVELRDVSTIGPVLVGSGAGSGASLLIRDAVLGASLTIQGEATVERSLSIGASLAGVSSDGTLSISHTEIRNAERFGILVTGGTAHLAHVVVAGTFDPMVPADIAARDADLTLLDVHLQPTGIGVAASRSTVVATRISITGGDLGFSFASSEAQLTDLSTLATEVAVRLEVGSTSIRNLTAIEGGTGIEVLGSDATRLTLDRSTFTNQTDVALHAAGGLARVDANDFQAQDFGVHGVRAESGATVRLRRASFRDAPTAAAAVRIERSGAVLDDLTMTDVFRGVDASRGSGVTVNRAEVRNVGVAAFIARDRDTTASLFDIDVHVGVGDAEGYFGRGLAVERGASMEAARVHLEQCREVAASVAGAGSALSLSDLTIVDALPRKCGSAGCKGQPLGVGVGAYYDAIATVDGFDVSADLACLQELGNAQVFARSGLVQSCAVGQYLESSPPATDLCYAGVDSRTNRTTIEPPDIDLP